MPTMPSLRAVTIVSASFLLLAKASGIPGAVAQNTPTTEYSVTLGDSDVCLPQINTARQSAGFNEFTIAKDSDDSTIWPGTSEKPSSIENYKTWVWKPVCDVLLGEQEEAVNAKVVPAKFTTGTYGFKKIESTSPNCTEIVDGWKAAYTNFKGIPPPKSENEDLYKVPENVSFVAMYNPSTNAAASCRVVTCNKKVSPAGGGRSARAGGGTGETGGTTTSSALMCLTTPDILYTDTETAPFTEDQWGQIVTAFEGSASTALPTLLGLTAAVLGVAASL